MGASVESNTEPLRRYDWSPNRISMKVHEGDLFSPRMRLRSPISSMRASPRPTKPGAQGQTINVQVGSSIHAGMPSIDHVVASFSSFSSSATGCLNNRWQEFDLVHAVVALHRIAKSTDYRELQDDARRRSGGRRSGADASELRGQLAALAAKAAEEVGMGGGWLLRLVESTGWGEKVGRSIVTLGLQVFSQMVGLGWVPGPNTWIWLEPYW